MLPLLLAGAGLAYNMFAGNQKRNDDLDTQRVQRQREDSAMQRKVSDYVAAGFNPLAALDGSAGSSSTPVQVSALPQQDMAATAYAPQRYDAEIAQSKAQKEVLLTQKLNNEKQNDLISAQTAEHQANALGILSKNRILSKDEETYNARFIMDQARSGAELNLANERTQFTKNENKAFWPRFWGDQAKNIGLAAGGIAMGAGGVGKILGKGASILKQSKNAGPIKMRNYTPRPTAGFENWKNQNRGPLKLDGYTFGEYSK